MNIFNRDQAGYQPPSQPGGHDRRLRILVVLLVILGGAMAFLASPWSEQTLGVKLSSLFSSANLLIDDTQLEQPVDTKVVDQPVFDCITAPCDDPTTQDPTKTDDTGGVFNCITAPCNEPHEEGTLIYQVKGYNPSGVFLIENNTIRPFSDGETFLCLGYSYNDLVVANEFDAELPVGPVMECKDDGGDGPVVINCIVAPCNEPHEEGSLIIGVKGYDPSGVFLIEKGKLRPFPSGDVFVCLGYDWDKIVQANEYDASLPVGEVMSCTNGPTGGPHPNGTLIVNVKGYDPSGVFLIENGQLRPFPSGEVFVCLGYDWDDIVQANDEDPNLPLGAVMSCTTDNPGGGGSGGGGSGTACSTDGLVPLYRFYNDIKSDHYYTTSNSAPAGYANEGITAYVYSSQRTGTVPLYQSYNPTRIDHYYTTTLSEATTFGYQLDGIVGYVYASQVSGSNPLYRMYNNAQQHYLMTSSNEERAAIKQIGFADQGTVGYTCGGSQPGSEIIEIYRLWSTADSDHFYTTSANERDAAAANGYTKEGSMGYLYSVPGNDREPVYRLYSPVQKDHFYTTSDAEANASGYNREGFIGYIGASNSSGQIELYRMVHSSGTDHFMTGDTDERNAAQSAGYVLEGSMGFMPRP